MTPKCPGSRAGSRWELSGGRAGQGQVSWEGEGSALPPGRVAKGLGRQRRRVDRQTDIAPVCGSPGENTQTGAGLRKPKWGGGTRFSQRPTYLTHDILIV